MKRTGTRLASAAVSESRLSADLPAGFGIGLIALGIAMAANSMHGPLLVDAIDYPVSDSMRNQTIGLDAATLVVIAPLTVLVGWLALSGHAAAPLLALGPTTYAVYIFVQYLAGPDHLNYPPVLALQAVDTPSTHPCQSTLGLKGRSWSNTIRKPVDEHSRRHHR